MNSVSLHSYDTTTGTRHDHHQPERSSVDREQPAFVSSGSRNMFHQRPPLCCWLLFSHSRSLFPNHLWKPIVTRLGTLDAAEENKVWYVRAPAMSNSIPKESTDARRYFLPRKIKGVKYLLTQKSQKTGTRQRRRGSSFLNTISRKIPTPVYGAGEFRAGLSPTRHPHIPHRIPGYDYRSAVREER